ncbi:TPA: hypothetical protein MBD98_003371 [Klebsiella aerogenes]|uniref:hypothetical protein n=1 Tax=Klebsiella aerogenes TaxID=548 RepID=UPI0014952803|nr:hypothetical protein [Klebsiella aerogenes]NPD51193.1 hypothetical protein [Klebsiella aerogenes]NPD78366.1 hypothetical protein [Klebsiella aerogenes]HBT2489133.1 hypothetical protein [Klebsiella aerogenes]HBT2499558.1 hypothetical protein [Klebsiella aerogenes]
MLTVLFYVLLCMAAAHFIYERILLPSVRLHYRNKLFELRDIVRNQIISNNSKEEVHAAELVHEALNNAINRLHLMTLPNRVRAQMRLSANPEIQARIRREVELFKRCSDGSLVATIQESAKILDKVLFFNSLMLILYTLPIMFTIWAIAKVLQTANRLLVLLTERQSLEQAVMLLPDRQVAKLVAEDNHAYA